MKKALRAGLIVMCIYTLMVSLFLYQAIFGKVSNDAGIAMAFFTLPISLLFAFIDLSTWLHIKESFAVLIHHPDSIRVSIAFETVVMWLLGCVQWGLFGALITWLKQKF